MRVLSSRPAERNGTRASGPRRSLRGCLDEVLPRSRPPRQRRSGRTPVGGDADTLAPRAVAVAVTARSAARRGTAAARRRRRRAVARPVLDRGAHLRPAAPARRAPPRPAHGATSPTTSSQPPAPSVERLHVGPLTLGALRAVLREQLGRVFPRPTLLRIHEASGGNPFYALELARALPTSSTPAGPCPCRRRWRSSSRADQRPTGVCAAGARAPVRAGGGGDGNVAEGRRRGLARDGGLTRGRRASRGPSAFHAPAPHGERLPARRRSHRRSAHAALAGSSAIHWSRLATLRSRRGAPTRRQPRRSTRPPPSPAPRYTHRRRRS